jgi:hypothetical protein
LRKERSDAVVRRVYELQIAHQSNNVSNMTNNAINNTSITSNNLNSTASWRTHCTVEALRSLGLTLTVDEFHCSTISFSFSLSHFDIK